MGLRETIGAALGGNDWDTIAAWLRDHYLESRGEKARMDAALKRERCYNGNAHDDMAEFIDHVFKHHEVRKLRKDFLPVGGFLNVIRRVVNEKATVYNEPARRMVDAASMPAYRDLVDATRLDEVMREANRRLVLDEDVMLSYRVRVNNGVSEPVIDVLGPGHFWVLCDPRDPTRVIGRIIKTTPMLRKPDLSLPHFYCEAEDVGFQIDGNRRVIVESIKPLAYGSTWLLLSATPPSARGSVLAENPSNDLVSAHFATWFVNLCLLKEAKSATLQVALSGDTSKVPVGQMSDTEGDIHLGEGVTVTQIDRSMDLAMFRDVSDFVLERTGAAHGLPPSVLHHRDSSSGSEIHLRRIPLRELRRQQIMIMRQAEHRLAEIMARVNAVEAPQYAFNASSWSIDFGEVEQPLTEAERDSVFENRRRLLLTNTADEIMRRDPDVITEQQALDKLKANVKVEVERVGLTQALSAMDGSASSGPDDPTAKDNGQQGIESQRQ